MSALVKRERPSGDQLPVFIHISKTGGTTLNRIISSNYGWLKSWSISGRNPKRSVAKLKERPQLLDGVDILQGHRAYGVHKYIERPVWYFTILRDPFARMISTLNYSVTTKKHVLYGKVNPDNLVEMYEKRYVVDNPLCRELVYQGFDHGPNEVKEMNEDDYLEALRILREEISYVGFLECMDSSVDAVSDLLSWEYNSGPLRNKTSKVKAEKMCWDESFIRSIVSYDLLLFEEALKLFPPTSGSLPVERVRAANSRVAQFKYLLSRVRELF